MLVLFQSQKVCYRSAHYSVAKALEESSLEIVEKIFFLSGNTKQTNIIKIMNNPDSLQRNLLTLISINILKKVFFFYKLKKIDAGTAASNSLKRL